MHFLPFSMIPRVLRKIQDVNAAKGTCVLPNWPTQPIYHITEPYKKLSRTAGIFIKIWHYIPLSTLICLYNSLLSSFLNYGFTVWGDSIVSTQEQIMRCIKFQPLSTHSLPIFKSLKILKLEDTLQLNFLKFLFKATVLLRQLETHFLTPGCLVSDEWRQKYETG